MVRRGLPERVAMKLTGHKTPSIFQRYNIVSDGDLRTAAAQLSGLTGAARQAAEAARRARASASHGQNMDNRGQRAWEAKRNLTI
jgi:hypothetical protein